MSIGNEYAGREAADSGDIGPRPQRERCYERDADGDGGGSRGLHADGGARNDVRRRAGARGFGDVLDRPPATGGVVLGDVDKGDAGDDADDAAEEEPVPLVTEEDFGRDPEADEGEGGDDVVAVIEGRHRVLPAVLAREQRHRCEPGDRRENAERAEDQRKHDPLQIAGHFVDSDAEDHRADVLR